MGWGDVLMAMGEARAIYLKSNVKSAMPSSRYKYGAIYAECPYVIRENEVVSNENINKLEEGVDIAPHVDWIKSTAKKLVFKKYKPKPAEIFFDNALDSIATDMANELGDFIFIDPHVKQDFSSNNRDWGWENYIELVRNSDAKFVQPNYGKSVLPGVISIETPHFLHACALLRGAKTAVFSEGGLMHAAAALSVSSVVIFGGFISPENTGYDLHYNFFIGKEGCGNRLPCKHCRAAMKKIAVKKVHKKLMNIYRS